MLLLVKNCSQSNLLNTISKLDHCIYVFADMVKNKGFLPSGPSEIFIQRNQIKDIVFSLLPACVDPDPESNVPFKVNAIIANPPAYGKTISLINFNMNYSCFDKVAWVVNFTFTLLLIKSVHRHFLSLCMSKGSVLQLLNTSCCQKIYSIHLYSGFW